MSIRNGLFKAIAVFTVVTAAMQIPGLPVSAETSVCSEVTTTNTGSNDYEVYSHRITSYLVKNGSGYMRVQAANDGSINVEYYSSDLTLTGVKHIPAELPIFGGFYAASDGSYFVFSGQQNLTHSDKVEVIRVTKYNSNWERVTSDSLYGANTHIPFETSTRIDECNGYIMMRSAHSMYPYTDGLIHQSCFTVQVNISTGKITDDYTILSWLGAGYVSHSFNQFVKADNGHFITLDHGDASPRSLVLGRYTTPASTGKFIDGPSIFDHTDAYTIPENTNGHYNFTGVSAGGFEISDNAYIIAANSVDITSYNTAGTRNAIVVSVPKTASGFGKPVTYQISDYPEGDVGASTPQLVKAGTGFIMLWQRYETVFYTKINGSGKPVGKIYSLEGALSDCQPIVDNGKIIWFSSEGGKTVFYTISTSDLSDAKSHSVISGHDYEFIESNNGKAKLICAKCGDTEWIDVPTKMVVFGNEDEKGYFYNVIDNKMQIGDRNKLLICTYPENIGNGDYNIEISDNDVLKFDRSSETLYATGCGTSDITFRLKYSPDVSYSFTVSVPHEHSFSEEWTIDKEPTCTEKGLRSHHCTVKGCNETSGAGSIPALGHSYVDEVVKPTYTEQGYTLHTCERCGDSYKDSFTDKLERPVETTTADTTVAPDITTAPVTTTTADTTTVPVTTTTAPVTTTTTVTTTAPVTTTAAKTTTAAATTTAPVTTTTTATTTAPVTTTTAATTTTPVSTTTAVTTTAHVHRYSKEVVAPTYTSEGYTLFTCDCGYSYTTGKRPALKLSKVSGIKCESTVDSITVKWTPVNDADGYRIALISPDNTRQEYTTTAALFTFSGLPAQTKYTVEITAFIGNITGKASQYRVNTLNYVSKPMYRDFTAKEITEHSISLTWKPVDHAEYYVIDRVYPDKKEKLVTIYADQLFDFTDRDLYSGSSYGYFITAYHGSSIVGEARKEFRTKAEDLSISGFKQTGCTETSIDLKWEINPNSGGYVVTVSNSGVKQSVEITRADTNTCTITGLSADKRYMVEIACLGDAGKRTRAVVTGKTAAGPVSNLRVTKITATYVGISFNKQNNANSYEVDILINGVWKSYDRRRINYLSGLESKTTYDLRVRSISGDFKSEYEYLTFTTL